MLAGVRSSKFLLSSTLPISAQLISQRYPFENTFALFCKKVECLCSSFFSQILAELLVELLHKLEADDVVPEISGLGTELVAVLMANLRLSLSHSRPALGESAVDVRRSAPQHLAKGKLQAILRGLVGAVLRSGLSTVVLFTL